MNKKSLQCKHSSAKISLIKLLSQVQFHEKTKKKNGKLDENPDMTMNKTTKLIISPQTFFLTKLICTSTNAILSRKNVDVFNKFIYRRS